MIEAQKKNLDTLYNTYTRMPLIEVIELRESLAIKPGELYRLGQDPVRERQLETLTRVMFEKLK